MELWTIGAFLYNSISLLLVREVPLLEINKTILVNSQGIVNEWEKIEREASMF